MPDLITSRANPRVKQLRAALAGNTRLAEGLIAIEGPHLLEEVLATQQSIQTIFLTSDASIPRNLPEQIELLHLSPEVFRSAAGTESPQGIAALLAPPVPNLKRMVFGFPLVLIAAGLQDPGNLGTLIRSALAFGATGLLTTPGTVSPFNGKAIRASAGAVFRLPLATADDEAFELLRGCGFTFFASVKDGGRPAHLEDLTGPTAFLIGNEGAGLSPAWLALADELITIPTSGPVESLNAAVAGSLLLYEAARQRLLSPPQWRVDELV